VRPSGRLPGHGLKPALRTRSFPQTLIQSTAGRQHSPSPGALQPPGAPLSCSQRERSGLPAASAAGLGWWNQQSRRDGRGVGRPPLPRASAVPLGLGRGCAPIRRLKPPATHWRPFGTAEKTRMREPAVPKGRQKECPPPLPRASAVPLGLGRGCAPIRRLKPPATHWRPFGTAEETRMREPAVPKGRQRGGPAPPAAGFCRPFGTGPWVRPDPAAKAAGNPLASLRDCGKDSDAGTSSPEGTAEGVPAPTAAGFCRPFGTGPWVRPDPAAKAAGNPLASLRDCGKGLRGSHLLLHYRAGTHRSGEARRVTAQKMRSRSRFSYSRGSSTGVERERYWSKRVRSWGMSCRE